MDETSDITKVVTPQEEDKEQLEDAIDRKRQGQKLILLRQGDSC